MYSIIKLHWKLRIHHVMKVMCKIHLICQIGTVYLLYQGQNLAYLLQLPAGLPKILILIEKHNYFRPSN